MRFFFSWNHKKNKIMEYWIINMHFLWSVTFTFRGCYRMLISVYVLCCFILWLSPLLFFRKPRPKIVGLGKVSWLMPRRGHVLSFRAGLSQPCWRASVAPSHWGGRSVLVAHLGICQEDQGLKRWKSSLENLFDRKRSSGGKKLLLADLLGSMTEIGLGY